MSLRAAARFAELVGTSPSTVPGVHKYFESPSGLFPSVGDGNVGLMWVPAYLVLPVLLAVPDGEAAWLISGDSRQPR